MLIEKGTTYEDFEINRKTAFDFASENGHADIANCIENLAKGKECIKMGQVPEKKEVAKSVLIKEENKIPFKTQDEYAESATTISPKMLRNEN
jgi:ankyrin repeat protein